MNSISINNFKKAEAFSVFSIAAFISLVILVTSAVGLSSDISAPR
ncbi:hypothetical protein [Candidatus Berkiella cookevillensis]|nr:hypothetical protein [Candidatus Berkiella cookevillensis]